MNYGSNSAWIKELCQEEEGIINREIGKVLRCIISLLEIRQHYNYQHSASFLNTPSVINMGEFRLLARGGNLTLTRRRYVSVT